MDKLEKILNVLGIIAIVLVTAGVIWFIVEFKEMMNDYRCSQLPINEFFQDKKCERYWRYRNDWKDNQ